MRIQSSTINLDSSHQLTESRTAKESLTVWQVGGPRLTLVQEDIGVSLTLSREANSLLSSAAQPIKTEESDELSLSDEDKLKIKLIESFVKNLTGKEIKIKVPLIKLKEQQAPPIAAGNAAPRVGWGLVYQAQEEIYEKESLSFAANGVITTTDGREIDLDLQFSMSREFYQQTNLSLRMGDAAKIDPLVINFSGTAPQLTAAKYTFDLDNNGTLDQISFLQEGSGFLAWDKNGDNIINNGGELFGPESGNGFADLAHHDSDSNNWIDENDPIFSRLRIWVKNAQGQDQLLALGQVGIGAIYLGHIQTPFALKNGAELQGEIQASGIFLSESGTAGTIQHIDLAV